MRMCHLKVAAIGNTPGVYIFVFVMTEVIKH